MQRNDAIRDKLAQLIAQYPFAPQSELARALGLSPARVSQLLKDLPTKPQRQTIPKATP